MSRLVDQYRARRVSARRARAINKVLARVPSDTMRDEILTIASRDL